TRRFYAWPRSPSFVDRFAQSHVVKPTRRSYISDACEPSHQRGTRILHTQNRGKRFEIFNWSHIAFRVSEDTTDEMCMCVDESRKQSHIAKVDHLSARGHRDRTARPHGDDVVVSYNDDRVGDNEPACSINQTGCFKNNRSLSDGRFRSLSSCIIE